VAVDRAAVLAQAGVSLFTEALPPDARRRLRRRGWFTALAADRGRAGCRGEWYRFRGVVPLGSFSRGWLTSVPQVEEERRRIEEIADRWFSV